MIIVIPADGMKSDSKVSASFGRAPYFFFYDAKTKESTWVKNSAATGPGGAGIKAAQIVVDHGATVLLTPRCGQNAADVIQAADIKIYQTRFDSLRENLTAFENGELPLLEEIHSGFHRHGGR